jgi:hypothetical protein
VAAALRGTAFLNQQIFSWMLANIVESLRYLGTDNKERAM